MSQLDTKIRGWICSDLSLFLTTDILAASTSRRLDLSFILRMMGKQSNHQKKAAQTKAENSRENDERVNS